MSNIRSPIVSVLGHVDHGKSSILDAIRESNIIATEAGAITQAIGASIVPLDAINTRCGDLLKSSGINFTIPGLVFIDTPGHAAFTSLRKRGGALADIAILVVDINEGFKPQTVEAIEILKSSKTPFVVAANKVDLVPGYTKKDCFLMKELGMQSDSTITAFEQKLYTIVGELHAKVGLVAERFDRIDDYTKQVAIVPCSATQKIGIPELLMVVAGMAQKYLEENLKINVSGPAKGTILEVKEEKGLGTTIDVILYDGTLDVNDTIVIGSLDGPIVRKVRALLEPVPLAEMRDKKSEFKNVDHITAATGVKIVAPDLDGVLSGMPLFEVGEDLEETKEEIQKQIDSVLIESEGCGVIVKADSIGSLEALIVMLKEKGVPVARASVGSISKKDIASAETSCEKNPLEGVILGFNVQPVEVPDHLNVICSDVIYRIIEGLEEWQESKQKNLEAAELGELERPCKLEFMRGHTFRQNNPAIVGVHVTAGTLKLGTHLMKHDGTKLGLVKSIQADQDNVQIAESGKQVAISLPGVTVGRQLNEGEMMIADIPETTFRKLKELKKYLKDDEREIMRELAMLKRENNPVWGV